MTAPTEVVLSYIDHLEEESYVREAVADHGVPDLIAAVVQAVDTLQCEDVTKAGLFVIDLCIGVLGTELAAEARSLLPSSGLFDGLARCLHAPTFSVRSHAVYTLGKLTFRENLALLERTFRERRDSDPLLMPDLLFEAFWLEPHDDSHWARTRNLAESPNCLSRWAALAVIEKHFKSEPVATVDDILARSTRDSFLPIRAEAAYRQAECNRQIANRSLTKEQFRAERSRLKVERSHVEGLRPKLTFDHLGATFLNSHRHPDYTTADVLAFLDSCGSNDAG